MILNLKEDAVNTRNGTEYACFFPSPLGEICMVSDGHSLTALHFVSRETFCPQNPAVALDPHLPVFEETIRWLELYFSGKAPDFAPPLFLAGTPFRKDVWEILKTIPYGRTMTYGAIASQIASSRNLTHMSAQAVGNAVGHNPVSLIIPCHRVIGTGGKLTGYSGGIWRKEFLLKLEKEHCESAERPSMEQQIC